MPLHSLLQAEVKTHRIGVHPLLLGSPPDSSIFLLSSGLASCGQKSPVFSHTHLSSLCLAFYTSLGALLAPTLLLCHLHTLITRFSFRSPGKVPRVSIYFFIHFLPFSLFCPYNGELNPDRHLATGHLRIKFLTSSQGQGGRAGSHLASAYGAPCCDVLGTAQTMEITAVFSFSFCRSILQKQTCQSKRLCGEGSR